jgi:hypothetical protein
MRDKIIAEIRRLAAEIGRSPGLYLFETETGLGAHHWRGRYWARWSDALREAGLEPNAKKAMADPDVLLEQLALATRRFGHCPTVDELSLYRRGCPVASHSTLVHHFGPRHEMLERLARWTAARPAYADVAALLSQPLESQVLPRETGEGDREAVEGASPAATTAPTLGVVRLYRCRDQYRLGRTGGSGRRARPPSIALPASAVLEHAITTDDPIGVEAYWLRRFAYRRLNPEWFALTAEDVAAFKRWREI